MKYSTDMKRKQFIRNSLFIPFGLSVGSDLFQLTDLNRNEVIKLRENRHNRHGYYGADFVENLTGNPILKKIRIDRFDNPEGQMLLCEFTYHDNVYRLAKTGDQVLMHNNGKITEFYLNGPGITRSFLSFNQDHNVRFDGPFPEISDYASALLLPDQNESPALFINRPENKEILPERSLLLLFS